MNLLKKNAAHWEAALREIDAKIASTRGEIAAHQASMASAAADDFEASTVAWVKRKAKLAETLEWQELRRQGIVKELEQTRLAETIEANQALRDEQEKRTLALLKKFPEAEARMEWLAGFFAECLADEEACRLFNAEKLAGCEPIPCAGQRASKHPGGNWLSFWMKASLPSVSVPFDFYWSMEAHPGRGRRPPEAQAAE